jgi:rRNA maturation RNase YbeY
MVNSKGVVRFHMREVVSIPAKKQLKESIAELMAEEGKVFKSLDYIFCSDEYLLEINQKFLEHDDLTDIITFDLSEDDGLIGEIYISVERVKDNSLLFNTDVDEELKRVIFHGALHLCGYKDKTKKDREEMRIREDYYLSKS